MDVLFVNISRLRRVTSVYLHTWPSAYFSSYALTCCKLIYLPATCTICRYRYPRTDRKKIYREIRRDGSFRVRDPSLKILDTLLKGGLTWEVFEVESLF